ncbi:MAG: Flp family type IVb pilin [Chloroflexi bacterium HGW-Chloroflexi-9]|nr:MAG: Flp family type IVb pilin [Chloroflexi bacterium HGW-Chloroflexi-9]
MTDAARTLHSDESGAAMTEYAIVVAGIAVVAIIAIQAVGAAVVGVFNDIVAAITSV